MSAVAIPSGELHRQGLERLYCEKGDHYFERRIVRGVKPAACPACKRPAARRRPPQPPRAPESTYGNGHLKTLYGYVADVSIRGDDLPACAAALRRLAAHAELLALKFER